jgi:drug/metabolite transporter (DMT)-like permease
MIQAPLPLQRQRLDLLAVAIMLVLCTLWGVQQVASKVALSQGIAPILQAVLRSVLAGPLLLLWIAARTGRPGLARLVAPDGSVGPGLLSGLMFAVEFILLFSGVQRTSASHAVVLLFTGGFFTAAGAHLFVPNERLRASQAAGLVLAFLGVLVTVGQGGGPSSLPGDLMVLGCAAVWGMTTVLVKANPALRRCPAEKVLAYQLFGALPLLTIATLLAGQMHMPHATPLAWASLIFQGAVIAFASYLAWFWLIARYPAGRLAAFSFLSPLLGVVAAALLLGDPLTPLLLVGLVLVCAGLWIMNR